MGYRIIAPVCSIAEINTVLEAGANEVYFGIMTREWINRYGNADFISRRQSEQAHFAAFDDFDEIIRLVNEHHGVATLVLNSRYSERQLPLIFEILQQWEDRGGQSVMVSDIGILLWLNDRHSQLTRQLSVMAGVFNSCSVSFFHNLNVSRIVLPREMSVAEIGLLTGNAGNVVEYESIVMFQKCEFIDSFCNFHHAFNYRPYLVSGYKGSREQLPVIRSYDPFFTGHGCQMAYTCRGVSIKHVDNNDFATPYCGACSLARLTEAGVNNFKIAGRGYPVERVVKSVRFIRQVLDRDFNRQGIKQQYRSVFGNDCCSKNCYYP